ncbi:MAG TPA: aminotransferase class III-fold pyridoxal phosphate-dependent enzyme, partial [Solirubrobacteraceae bacterium]|nr:aminotransferase class III-fold pyridoxal phosphate-dependent enzyme [Solirubrobacteraceae bacterium]
MPVGGGAHAASVRAARWRLRRRVAVKHQADGDLVDAVDGHGIDVLIDRPAALLEVGLVLASLELLERPIEETEVTTSFSSASPRSMWKRTQPAGVSSLVGTKASAKHGHLAARSAGLPPLGGAGSTKRPGVRQRRRQPSRRSQRYLDFSSQLVFTNVAQPSGVPQLWIRVKVVPHLPGSANSASAPRRSKASTGRPKIGGSGVIPPPPGYLEGVRELCTTHGIVYIADEVLVGFGRTGEWFGVDHARVSPDLMAFAKGVNSGYVPLGGVLVSDPIYDTFVQRPYPGGLTYAGHPLACAAAVGTLRVLHDESLIASAARLGNDVLGPGLLALAQQHPSVG